MRAINISAPLEDPEKGGEGTKNNADSECDPELGFCVVVIW